MELQDQIDSQKFKRVCSLTGVYFFLPFANESLSVAQISFFFVNIFLKYFQCQSM